MTFQNNDDNKTTYLLCEQKNKLLYRISLIEQRLFKKDKLIVELQAQISIEQGGENNSHTWMNHSSVLTKEEIIDHYLYEKKLDYDCEEIMDHVEKYGSSKNVLFYTILEYNYCNILKITLNLQQHYPKKR